MSLCQRITIYTSMVLLASMGLALMVQIARAESFYQWETSEGTLSFTEEPTRIPLAYESQAVERSFEDVAAKTEDHLTPHSTSHPNALQSRLRHLRELNAVNQENPNRQTVCNKAVYVSSVRQQVGEYNRRFLVVTDECGRTVSVTQHYPHIEINR